eukprot:scaffold45693_cov65-Phaeocystis_antarctica.AAC.6
MVLSYHSCHSTPSIAQLDFKCFKIGSPLQKILGGHALGQLGSQRVRPPKREHSHGEASEACKRGGGPEIYKSSRRVGAQQQGAGAAYHLSQLTYPRAINNVLRHEARGHVREHCFVGGAYAHVEAQHNEQTSEHARGAHID